MRHILTISLLALAACSTAQKEEVAEAPAAAAMTEAPESAKADIAAKKKADKADKADKNSSGDWTTFGGEFTLEEILPAAALLSDPAPYTDKTVRVEGRVADVCQKAGCWMVIAEGDKTMRVRMKDHDFAVAKDGAGSQCQIEGVITAKPLDPEEAEHFASESANTDVMPENGMEAGAMTYEIIASAVQFKK